MSAAPTMGVEARFFIAAPKNLKDSLECIGIKFLLAGDISGLFSERNYSSKAIFFYLCAY